MRKDRKRKKSKNNNFKYVNLDIIDEDLEYGNNDNNNDK